MEKEMFNEIMSHIDIAEVMIREKKAEELIAIGKYDEAVACAMAEGIRMGWEAHKKMMEG